MALLIPLQDRFVEPFGQTGYLGRSDEWSKKQSLFFRSIALRSFVLFGAISVQCFRELLRDAFREPSAFRELLRDAFREPSAFHELLREGIFFSINFCFQRQGKKFKVTK